MDSISAGTSMGPVSLLVADLDAELRFYRDVLGLGIVAAPDPRIEGIGRPDVVALGRGGRTSVVLRHVRELPPARRGEAGLFHTAIVFDDRDGLAAALASVAARAPHAFVGSADHLVSQAFYLTDPEGNGVELYWDRPRETWDWDDAGHVRMATLPLDPNGFLREHAGAARVDGVLDAASVPGAGGAVVGHVHLQVGDVAAARSFYVDALGFEVTASMRGALFVSAGGYHHHLAVNTWNSSGAGPRASSLGLGEVTVELPGPDDLGALRERALGHGVAVADDGGTLVLADPWRNVVRARVRA